MFQLYSWGKIPVEENENMKTLYAARFQRDLNSIIRQLNQSKNALETVIVKSRRTETAIVFAVAANTYEILAGSRN